jgi:hypothetical protein
VKGNWGSFAKPSFFQKLLKSWQLVRPGAIHRSAYARIIDLSKVLSPATFATRKRASDARPVQAYSTMAMMASGPAGNPYDQNDTIIEQDLLEDGKATRIATATALD